MTFITVHLEVSCLFRFTLAANSLAHTSQFGDGGPILYYSRIRKYVTYRIRKNVTYIQRTENREQTKKPITEATLLPYR